MALTLDATLQAALDGTTHRPIVKIVSTSAQADIPFDGNFFNLGATAESDSNFKALATGQLALTFVQGNDLRFIVSNAERTSWSDVLLYNGDNSGYHVQDAAFVELASGNIGVIFITLNSTTYRLFRMVITPAGAIVTAATEIQNTTYVLDSPTLCPLSTGGFLLVYKHYAAGTYSLYKRTCDAAFATWSTASAITLTGTVADQEKNHPALLAAASGRIYLFFDYVDDVLDDKTQANIYQIYSADNGVTWSAPAAVTSYSGFSTSAIHPSVGERGNGDIALAFHEQRFIITIGRTSTGWANDANNDHALWVHFDPASAKVFIALGWTASGLPVFGGLVVIDTTTWMVEKAYTQSGTPGYNSFWVGSTVNATRENSTTHADGQRVAVASSGIYQDDARAILLFDHSSETVREYFFDTDGTYGFQRNVEVSWENSNIENGTIKAVFLDDANDRLYVAIEQGSLTYRVKIGYFDLTETADPITGMYEFHNLIYIPSDEIPTYALSAKGLYLRVYPNDDRVVLSCCTGISNYNGYLKAFSLSTGSEIKSYTNSNNSGFHLYGMRWPVLINNKIYGGIYYTANYSQNERRGIMVIDLASDTVVYERPTFATVNDYGLADLKPIEGGNRIIMASSLYGVVFYDVNAHTWTLYDGNNIPGFPNIDGSYGTARVSYDETNNYIFTMDQGASAVNYSLAIFVEGGSFYLGKYIIGTLSGSDYNFGDTQTLTLYTGTLDLSILYDEDDVIWATWTKYDYDDNEQSIQWDRDAFGPDLSSYIVAGSPVSITTEIGKTSTLEFTLSRGDLFDPTNLLSIYAPVVSKGRIVEVWFGEIVGGLEYWQTQGKRVVTGLSMNYRSTDHPVLTVTCEDPAIWWPEMIISATTAFHDTEFSSAFTTLMGYAQLEASEYTVPTLPNEHSLYVQWVEENFQSIMDDVCDHFGCFGVWQVDGTYTLKPIDLSAAVSHTYTGKHKLIDWTTDDRYGSFINRVTVRCEGHESLEVLWDEERVGSKNGTVGFWTKNETHRIYFSNDRTRRCRYVRMEVINSINDYGPLLEMIGMQGQEEISAIDPDETWVEVSIESPDRALYAFGFAALVLAVGTAAVTCGVYFSAPCGPFIMATNLALSMLISILTAVANFQYDFYARPVGHEKQMYQATANDVEFQQFMGGKIIQHEFDDPLSHSVPQCQMVADHEIDVLRGQRNRVKFKKVMHLQDEIGDIIQIIHPLSSQETRLFINKILRTMTVPGVSSDEGSGGEFSDQIEGWRLI